jgi:hypothetical protein
MISPKFTPQKHCPIKVFSADILPDCGSPLPSLKSDDQNPQLTKEQIESRIRVSLIFKLFNFELILRVVELKYFYQHFK